jgi:excisionase family DNA binding protein
MDDDFLTVQQAASRLRVTDGAVRLALSQGRLPFVEKYGRKLIAHPDLNAYQQRTQPEGVKKVGRPHKR